jgi:hypothetical protein
MLLGEPAEKIRVLKANIVLCPNMQIMAVVTKDTPLFTEDSDVNNLINRRSQEMDQREREVAFAAIKKMDGYQKAINGLYNIIALAKAMRLKSSGESRNVIDQAIAPDDLTRNARADLEQLLSVESKQAQDENARMINSALVAFGRELNMKLYFSRDMRIFKEFSA